MSDILHSFPTELLYIVQMCSLLQSSKMKGKVAKISKVGDLWFETSTLGLSEKIFNELAGERFEGKLMEAHGEEQCYGFSH